MATNQLTINNIRNPLLPNGGTWILYMLELQILIGHTIYH